MPPGWRRARSGRWRRWGSRLSWRRGRVRSRRGGFGRLGWLVRVMVVSFGLAWRRMFTEEIACRAGGSED